MLYLESESHGELSAGAWLLRRKTEVLEEVEEKRKSERRREVEREKKIKKTPSLFFLSSDFLPSQAKEKKENSTTA